MTTLLPELERQLNEAATRTHPPTATAPRLRARTRRRRLILAVVAVVLFVASAAVAAVTIGVGESAPDTIGLGSPVAGPGHPVDGTTRVLALRVPDPDGGPSWGLRIYRTARGGACWQVGRVLDGRLGLLGRDGLLGDDGLFHPLPVQQDQCRPLDGAGNVFAYQAGFALANGAMTRLTCRLTFAAPNGQRACPERDQRFVWLGFLGPQARSITLDGEDRRQVSPTQEGAFLYVTRLDVRESGRNVVVQSARRILRATYADGTTRRVTDIAPLETARNGPPRGPTPPGYVPPERTLPSPSRLRTPVRVSKTRWGRNTVYRLHFKVPVSARRYGVQYSVLVDGPGQGRDCARPLNFGGFNLTDNVKAGQAVSIAISPAIALRWNKGWCPGTYRGRVVLHDRAHTLDTFTFTVPRN